MGLNWFRTGKGPEPEQDSSLSVEELQQIYQTVAKSYKNLRVRHALIQALSDDAQALETSRVPLSSEVGDFPEVLQGELWAVKKSIDQIESELKEVQEESTDESLESQVQALEAQLGELIQPVRESEEEQTRLAVQKASLRRLDQSIQERKQELDQLEAQLQARIKQLDQVESIQVPSAEKAIIAESEKWQELADLI